MMARRQRGNSAVEARERLSEGYDNQLQRAASLFDIMRGFPAGNRLYAYDLTTGGDNPQVISRNFNLLPYVVQPAQELELSGSQRVVTRRLATQMQVEFAAHRINDLGLRVHPVSLPSPTPVPDSVFFNNHPVALGPEDSTPRDLSYPCGLDGEHLSLYGAFAMNYQFEAPNRRTAREGVPETINWDIMKRYPPEAVEPSMLEFHQQRLDRLTSMLGQIAAALADPSLNPR
jgi:hypothetical protein